MLYAILALMCAILFAIVLVMRKNTTSLGSAIIRLHGELDSLGKELIFCKGELEKKSVEIDEVRLANKVLKAKLSRKNCKRKKQENPALAK